MLREMTGVEFDEWQAFYEHEHLGANSHERSDLRAGIISAAIYNHQAKRGSRLAKPSEFLPDWKETGQPADNNPYTVMGELAAETAGRRPGRKKRPPKGDPAEQ